MITTRTAKQCGQADYGWLQARYTFSFGHYFDPTLLGYASFARTEPRKCWRQAPLFSLELIQRWIF